jgi:glycosyltransferase involved in cell wall biosynthesis
MKIAQISPLYESVPPQLYGGTERVVHNLTEELVRLGHEVTLFASGDSTTSSRLVAPYEKALRLDEKCTDMLAPHFAMIEMVEREASNFDIIHSHIDYLYYPVMKRNRKNYLTTLHGRLDLPELYPLYKEFSEVPVVSISNSQRKPLPFANWKGTVYHGLPANLFRLNKDTGKYLAFLGRICPEKGVDRAIDVAIRTGIPIRIAAKIDKADQEYFDIKIKHLLNHPLVEFLGEIGEVEKQEFLGNALGVLHLIDWPEPFGLVMIESLACGTPVIAYPFGSVPEIVDDSITGFIVRSQEEAVEAVGKLHQINREKCRQVFEQRFSVEGMAVNYLSIYEKVLSEVQKDFSIINGNGVMGNVLKDQSAYGT